MSDINIKNVQLFRKIQQKERNIELLPFLKAIPSKNEQFKLLKKFKSPEVSGRNSSFLTLVMEVIQRNLDYCNICIIDSANNVSAFYAYLATQLPKNINDIPGKTNLCLISHSTKWTPFNSSKITISPYKTLEEACSNDSVLKKAAQDGVFLDACNTIVTLLNWIYLFLDVMSREGGAFGLSFYNKRKLATFKSLRKRNVIDDEEICRNIKPKNGSRVWTAKDLIFGENGIGCYSFDPKSNDSIGEQHGQWAVKFCEAAAKRAGFYLQLFYNTAVGDIRTIIFRAIPVSFGKPRVCPLVNNTEIICSFWENIDPTFLLSQDGLLLNEFIGPVLKNCMKESDNVKDQFHFEKFENYVNKNRDWVNGLAAAANVRAKTFGPTSAFGPATAGYKSRKAAKEMEKAIEEMESQEKELKEMIRTKRGRVDDVEDSDVEDSVSEEKDSDDDSDSEGKEGDKKKLKGDCDDDCDVVDVIQNPLTYSIVRSQIGDLKRREWIKTRDGNVHICAKTVTQKEFSYYCPFCIGVKKHNVNATHHRPKPAKVQIGTIIEQEPHYCPNFPKDAKNICIHITERTDIRK